jgi:hypothetical protein
LNGRHGRHADEGEFAVPGEWKGELKTMTVKKKSGIKNDDNRKSESMEDRSRNIKPTESLTRI